MSESLLLFRVATSRKRAGKNNNFLTSGQSRKFFTRSGKILDIYKSQGILFSYKKARFKTIYFDTIRVIQVMHAGTEVLVRGFSFILIIHLANSKSVKIVQRTVKSPEKIREHFSF